MRLLIRSDEPADLREAWRQLPDQEGLGLDPSARPGLTDALTVRDRQAADIEAWLAEVTPEQLAEPAPVPEDDRWPPYAEGRRVRQCLARY